MDELTLRLSFVAFLLTTSTSLAARLGTICEGLSPLISNSLVTMLIDFVPYALSLAWIYFDTSRGSNELIRGAAISMRIY